MMVNITRYEIYLLLGIKLLTGMTFDCSAIFYNHSNLIFYILDANRIMIILLKHFDFQYKEVQKNE